MSEQPVPPNRSFFQDATRLNLALGFVTGVAALAAIGFFILLAKVGGEGSGSKVAATNTASPSPTVAAADTQPTGPVDLPAVTKDDHVQGKAGAKVVVTEFSDIQCPFCRQFHPSIKRLIQDYGDKVQVVYKHFPLDSIHPMARPAALASECAAEQGKFWEFLDKSFEQQSLLGADFFTSTAKSLGLNEKQFKDCVDTQKFASHVDADAQLGETVGVSGTPSSFVNGLPLSGAQPYESLKAMVDQALAAA